MNISEMLQLDAFKNAKVLAGQNGVNNIVINGTLIDAPDGYNWTRKGDFIATTGYPFMTHPEWQAGLMRMLEILVKKGCSGIGFKLGRYIFDLPQEVISFANDKNFPIISLPNELSWSDIIVPIVTEINKQHRYELEMTHKVYEQFHNHLKMKGNLHDLGQLLYSIVGLPVTIYIKNSNEIINTHNHGFPISEINNIISTKFCGEDQTIQRINWNNEEFTVRWILDSNQLTAGVFLWGKLILHAWKKAALEQTAVITALEIERLRTISTTYQHLRNEFLVMLLDDTKLEREAILRRAKELNWDLEDNYKVILLDCDLDIQPKNSNLPIWQRKLSMLEDFKNELQWSLPNTLMGFDLQNRFILLLPNIENDDKVVIEKLKGLILKVNITSFYGGIGSKSSIENLSSSYNEAILASQVAFAKMAKSNNVKEKNQLYIECFHKLDVERILFSQNPRVESKIIAEEYLQKVLDYDKEKNSELLTTLKSFINNDANFDDTANEMFIHKNTVRYRINLIHKLTNLNPGKMKDLFLLQIAIKTIDVLYPSSNP